MKNFNNVNCQKAVIQHDKEGKEINTFHSVSCASRKTGATVANIVSSIDKLTKSGKPRTAGGYIWKYVNNEVD